MFLRTVQNFLEKMIATSIPTNSSSTDKQTKNMHKGTIISELITGWKISNNLPKYGLMKRETVEYMDVPLLEMFLNEEHLKLDDPNFMDYTAAQNASIHSNLKLLCAEVNCLTSTIDTTWNQRYEMARLYPDNGHSLVVQPRFIKHTIWYYLGYVDGDLVAAHPTFLYCLCKQNSYPCPILEHYIFHRELVLAEVVSYYDVSRDQAKMLFNIILYGGGFKTWTDELLESKHNRVDINVTHHNKRPLKFIRYFQSEIIEIQKVIVANNPE
jgi:hypothetical protein